jgi:hypothetical protein
MVCYQNIRLQLSKKPRNCGGLSGHLSEGMMRRLMTLFPSEFLKRHAEELGVVGRDRTFHTDYCSQLPVIADPVSSNDR